MATTVTGSRLSADAFGDVLSDPNGVGTASQVPTVGKEQPVSSLMVAEMMAAVAAFASVNPQSIGQYSLPPPQAFFGSTADNPVLAQKDDKGAVQGKSGDMKTEEKDTPKAA